MRSKWLLQLVQGTVDAAFAIDASGLISAWNTGAEELFGLRLNEVIGRPCHEVVKGSDEAGPFCAQHCSVHNALETNQPVANFDLLVQTKTGREWCNLTIQIVSEPGSNARYAVHGVRRLDIHRLIQQLGRVINEGQVTGQSQTAARLISSSLARPRRM